VGGYRDFVRERFERCLDLYLCPRKLKKRLNIDPETLVPRLPRPRELKPFPNSLVLQFLGHKKAVRSISVSPDGQYLATGGEDGTVRLWEVDTCLCRYTWTVGKPSTVDGKKTVEPVCTVAFNPNTSHHVLAVAVGSRLVLITTGTGDADAAEVTEALLASAESAAKAAAASKGDSDDDYGSDEDADGDEEESGGNKRKRKTVCSWHTISAPSSSSSVPRPCAASKRTTSNSSRVVAKAAVTGPGKVQSRPSAGPALSAAGATAGKLRATSTLSARQASKVVPKAI
jgi:ribosome biogenesis protein ERB1